MRLLPFICVSQVACHLFVWTLWYYHKARSFFIFQPCEFQRLFQSLQRSTGKVGSQSQMTVPTCTSSPPNWSTCCRCDLFISHCHTWPNESQRKMWINKWLMPCLKIPLQFFCFNCISKYVFLEIIPLVCARNQELLYYDETCQYLMLDRRCSAEFNYMTQKTPNRVDLTPGYYNSLGGCARLSAAVHWLACRGQSRALRRATAPGRPQSLRNHEGF